MNKFLTPGNKKHLDHARRQLQVKKHWPYGCILVRKNENKTGIQKRDSFQMNIRIKIAAGFAFIFLMAHAATAEANVIEFDQHKYLVNTIDPNEKIYDEVFEKLKSALTKHHAVSGTIESCKKIIDIPVGTAHGNHSYGGICSLRYKDENIRIMICADELVGHNVVSITQRGFFFNDLVKFTALNCYGG